MKENVTAQDQKAPATHVVENFLPRAVHRVCSSGSVTKSWSFVCSHDERIMLLFEVCLFLTFIDAIIVHVVLPAFLFSHFPLHWFNFRCDGGRKVTMDEVMILGGHPALKCEPWLSHCLVSQFVNGANMSDVINQHTFSSVCVCADSAPEWFTLRFCHQMIERHAQKYIKFCQDMDKSLEETLRFLNQAGIWFVTATDTSHRCWSFVWLMLVDFSITVWNQSCQFAFSKLLNACVSLVCCLFVCCQDMPGIRVRIPISGRNWLCVPSLNMDQGPDMFVERNFVCTRVEVLLCLDDSVTREHHCKKCFI